jgi:ABC-type multidrug transport system fused ATPase/permease subunit
MDTFGFPTLPLHPPFFRAGPPAAGRTGSGKSSLAIALFRIVEPCGGSIALDGVDTSSVPLSTLRSRLSIIPQDPVLFSTTLRANMDPFQRHSDEELKHALAQVRLSHLPLDSAVSEGGGNLSVGERQLLW